MNTEHEIEIYVRIEDAEQMIDILRNAGYDDIGTDADYSRPNTHQAIIIRVKPIMELIEAEIMGVE